MEASSSCQLYTACSTDTRNHSLHNGQWNQIQLILLSAASSASGLAFRFSGKKIDIVVPRYPDSALATRMLPSCFSRIARLTQSPSPLPLSSLVVANGVNNFDFIPSGIPIPLSAT